MKLKYSDYKESLVAFIDVLGAKDLINNIESEEDFNAVALFISTIKQHSESWNTKLSPLVDLHISAISDSMIVTIPFSDPTCAVSMFILLHTFQYGLLISQFKLLCRGYVAKGPVYHRDNYLFGRGYINAYLGEKKIKGPPRIIIDPRIIQIGMDFISKAQTEGKVKFLDFLREDADGLFFIDYFKPVGLNVAFTIEQYRNHRRIIGNFISDLIKLYSYNQHISAKYEWLKLYYEATEIYYK